MRVTQSTSVRADHLHHIGPGQAARNLHIDVFSLQQRPKMHKSAENRSTTESKDCLGRFNLKPGFLLRDPLCPCTVTTGVGAFVVRLLAKRLLMRLRHALFLPAYTIRNLSQSKDPEKVLSRQICFAYKMKPLEECIDWAYCLAHSFCACIHPVPHPQPRASSLHFFRSKDQVLQQIRS